MGLPSIEFGPLVYTEMIVGLTPTKPTLACHAIELIVDKDLNLWRLAYNSSIPISERSWSYKLVSWLNGLQCQTVDLYGTGSNPVGTAIGLSKIFQY